MTTEQRLLVILEGIKNELRGIREALESNETDVDKPDETDIDEG